MKKYLIGGAVGLAMTLALPIAAMAATSITFLTFPNSGPNATIAAGDTVDTKVTFDLTGTSELESMSLQIVDNAGNNIGMPETCFDVADRVVAGTFTRVGPFDTTGGTEGTFGIRVRGYGVTGPGTDNNCGGTVNDNQYFSNRLTLTEEQNTGGNANNTGTGGGGTGGSSGMPGWFSVWLNTFNIANCTNSGGTWNGSSCTHPTAPAPPVNTACSEYATLSAGLSFGSDTRVGGRVGQLQSFLMGKGFSIPLLYAQKVPYGFYGMQTQGAASAFVQANHC